MTSSTTDRRLGLTGSAAIKVPCKAAATANITLSGEQTIDGFSCVTGDRVLVKSQTSSVDNGIYVCDTGTWTRDLDFDGPNDVTTGTIVMVLNGSSNSNTYWRLATTGTITFGTSAITFASALASDSALLSFTQTGSGAVTRTAQDKMRDVVDPVDYGGTGEKQPIRLARAMGYEFYDDFLRANTSAGSLGTPAMGTAYQMLGINTAATATQTNISGCKWISAPGDIVYATQTLTGNVGAMEMTTSWGAGNSGSDEGVAAMLIGPTKTAGSLAVNLALHFVASRTSWALQTYTASVPTTVVSGAFSPTLSLDTSYTFRVTISGTQAHYELPGVTDDCYSAAFATNIGKYATWEHFYQSSSVVDVLRFDEIGAGRASYPRAKVYEDQNGIVFANNYLLTTFSSNTRNFYLGSSGIIIFASNGTTPRLVMTDSGLLTLPAYGSGGGALTVGAADSGGAGFKLLRVPN